MCAGQQYDGGLQEIEPYEDGQSYIFLFEQDEAEECDKGHVSTEHLVIAATSQHQREQIGLDALLVLGENRRERREGTYEEDDNEEENRGFEDVGGVLLEKDEHEERKREQIHQPLVLVEVRQEIVGKVERLLVVALGEMPFSDDLHEIVAGENDEDQERWIDVFHSWLCRGAKPILARENLGSPRLAASCSLSLPYRSTGTEPPLAY